MTCNQIIKYTTPTIRITFPTIDTSLISEAYLSFKVGPTTLLALDSYTTEVGLISFTLTQEQTGAFPLGTEVTLVCDWKLNDGTRGRSKTLTCRIAPAGKSEVI